MARCALYTRATIPLSSTCVLPLAPPMCVSALEGAALRRVLDGARSAS